MSDENKTENDDWRLDSLEEEDDIIELTEEIELPSQPVISKQDPQEKLDEIVIDLEDSADLESDDEIHELMEAAVEETELENIAPIEEGQETVFDLGEDRIVAPDDGVHELMETDIEETELEDIAAIEEGQETVFDLGEDRIVAPDDGVHELMETDIEETELEDIAAIQEAQEPVFDLGSDSDSVSDGQVDESMEAAEKLDFKIEEDESTEPYEQIEALSVASLDEIDLEEEQPLDRAEEFGMPDIETEVDIAEIADLEPIQSEFPAQEVAGDDADGVMQLQEDLKADPEAVMELQEELAPGQADPASAASDDIIEISDFDQQYFSDEEAQSATSGLPTIDSAEEDDFLELIDVEDVEEDGAELDDEIIPFDQTGTDGDAFEMDDILADPDQDDFDLAPASESEDETDPVLQTTSSEDLTNESEQASLITGADDFLEKPPVPGFFEATEIDDGGETEIDDLADSVAGLPSDEMDNEGAAVSPAAVSNAHIEAAVKKIIERDYADRIESMVATAIEKVVSLEIERIKSSLFGDEND